MNKDNLEDDSNFLFNKKRENKEKSKKEEKIYYYNSQKEVQLLKLTNIANKVENRDCIKYKKLICPFCKKKNLLNSLIFENLKEFILYLAYIFTFIPQSYRNCKLFFFNKDEIINYFRFHKYEKPFFLQKNTILICKDCLIKKMNQKNFINIFSSVFGCNTLLNINNKINKKNSYSKSIEYSHKIKIAKKIDSDNNKSNIKLEIDSKVKNITHENDNLETTCTNDTNLNNNNQLSSSFNTPFNYNQLNCSILKNSNVNSIENKNDNCDNNKSNVNHDKNNINLFNEEKNSELLCNKILENFENTFNSIFQGFSNMIFEMRKFNIKTSEKKNEKEYEEYIKNLKELKTELKPHIKMLSTFQNNYCSEITRLINKTPNKKLYLKYNIEMNYIYEETKEMNVKFINSLNFFQSLLRDYLVMLELEKK